MTNTRPIMLGIVGDSAAGKTTLTRGLTRLLGPEHVTHICTDDYHKYDRIERAGLNITPLHPDCNYLDILELHLERAHNGQPILKPVYDHRTGSLARPEYVQPREFVVVEGLLGFHTPAMRQLYDVKVFLDPPEDSGGVGRSSAILPNAVTRPSRSYGNYRGANGTRCTSSVRSASLPISWCGSFRLRLRIRISPTAI